MLSLTDKRLTEMPSELKNDFLFGCLLFFIAFLIRSFKSKFFLKVNIILVQILLNQAKFYFCLLTCLNSPIQIVSFSSFPLTFLSNRLHFLAIKFYIKKLKSNRIKIFLHYHLSDRLVIKNNLTDDFD